MFFRSTLIYVGIFILVLAVAGLWVRAYRNFHTEQDNIVLKDESTISGKIIEQEFGKYIVVEKADGKRQVIVWEQIQDIDLSNPRPWYLNVDVALEGILNIGVIGGFIVFAIGLWQYREAQKWKRAEFLLKEIDKYEINPDVVNARNMLDFSGQKFFLHGKNNDAVEVDHALLASALSKKTSNPSDDEQKIIEIFDIYLSNLERINNFIESGLVKKNELRLYVEYWLKLIGDENETRLSTEARKALWNYIIDNKFEGTEKLLKTYGYSITKSDQHTAQPVINS